MHDMLAASDADKRAAAALGAFIDQAAAAGFPSEAELPRTFVLWWFEKEHICMTLDNYDEQAAPVPSC